MSDEVTFTFTAEGMIPPPRISWLRRLWLRITRRPLPQPIQPPGTRPLMFDIMDGDTVVRYYIPAARIEKAE